MKSKLSLCAGAALGLALAAGVAAPSQAAPRSAAASQAAEIRELRAQIEALTARINAQEAAQAQTQATAQQAQASAQAVATQVQAVQASADSQIKLIPDQVKTAVAANTPKPKKSWTDDTVVSGRMYFDLGHISNEVDGVKKPPSGDGFDIKRFYVGIDHNFNGVFSGNITTDFQYSSAIGATELYIKKAYLQAKLSDALVIRAGSTDLPWVPFVEDIYGYRYVENTLIDRTKFGTSADWGIHAQGKLGPVFSYAVAVVNGAGYKNPSRGKGMDIEGRLSAQVDNLVFAVGGYSGKLGKEVQGSPVQHTASRLDALAAYKGPNYRVGLEYFSTKDWNNVTTAASDKADGYSVFGSWAFNSQFSAFGRYDYVKPTKDTASAKKDGYYNVGLTYSPTKIVDLSLVYKHDKVENGTLSTSNGVIGGVRDGTYDEIGVFGQFRY